MSKADLEIINQIYAILEILIFENASNYSGVLSIYMKNLSLMLAEVKVEP